jgi:ATP-dependent helicase/nuclease subunit B
LPDRVNCRLVLGIGCACSENVLEEKRLLAPSRRTGIQWLDRVATSGQPVMNCRVTTIEGLAMEIAAPEVERLGLAYPGDVALEVLLARALEDLRGGGGYLSGMGASPGLTRTIRRAVTDLRLAGQDSSRISPDAFEVGLKGEEVAGLLAEYEKRLKAEGMLDYAGMLELARLRACEAQPIDGLLLVPVDLAEGLAWAEKALLESFPRSMMISLEVDEPGGEAGDLSEALSDSGLLRWVADPSGAPEPERDGSASVFRAVGEVNEVREVLRRCVEDGIPFDQVEILHTDTETYVPLVYEIASRLVPDDDELPVTFAEGIPLRYSRPARALLFWLEWMRGGYPQTGVVRAVRDGLLSLKGTSGISFSRLSAILQSVPIGHGDWRYLPKIDEALAAACRKSRAVGDDGGEDRPSKEAAEALAVLRGLANGLLELAERAGGSHRGLLEASVAFLKGVSRSADRFDEYSRVMLTDRILELEECLDQGDVPGLDVGAWLEDLARSAHVMGAGPRPGKLHLARALSGGHSGRGHTFIVGMDDSRFPGAMLQDPILLDTERIELSRGLPAPMKTASQRLSDRVRRDFARLLARLRGEVSISYCCRGLSDDREMFPSPAALAVYRILSGDHAGDRGTMLEWTGHPVSFAPDSPDRCVDITEWWLWRTCSAEAVSGAARLIAASFPHLGRGMKARAARRSADFTEYDGYVPEAGEEHDPRLPDGPVLSASRIEMLGRCPMEYFFRYVLGIKPPEEQEIDPSTWLDPAERGKLLHDVFRGFMTEICRRGERPREELHGELLAEVLAARVDYWRERKPPPGPDVFEREVSELSRTATVFLKEEEPFCLSSKPMYFEAAIGMPPGEYECGLDSPQPATVHLPDGTTVRVRGRIDRVDLAEGPGGDCFTIWDYKTGSSRRYEREDPFQQGRLMQNAIYLELARARLEELHPGCTIVSFGYFFPSYREHGERITWTEQELSGHSEILAGLCRLLSAGCFPFTDSPDDVFFSDYGPAFGDPSAAAADAARKLEEAGVLAPFARLREYVTGAVEEDE